MDAADRSASAPGASEVGAGEQTLTRRFDLTITKHQ
jgi:hypothetical protein